MNTLTSGLTGTFHLIVSIIAMISGMMVLCRPKGTKGHKQVGYIYVIAMLLVNLTAFLIYRLFGGFGIFHFFAIVSLLTLLAGMYPILKRKGQYLFRHFNYMYCSVVGLYCAFCAEVLARVPLLIDIQNSWELFSLLVGVSIFVVMLIATLIFKKYKPIWKNQFQA